MNLKRLRIARELTQAQLGREVGGHKSDVSRCESGRFLPNPEMARNLAVALSATLDALFDEEEKALFRDVVKRKTKNRPVATAAERRSRENRYIQIRARIPREMRPALDRWLSDAGYASTNEWILQCIYRLRKEAERRRGAGYGMDEQD